MQAPTKPSFPVSLRYLRRPLWVLLLNALLLALAATQLNEFHFDASSDTLVVEGDPDLLEYQGVVLYMSCVLCERFLKNHNGTPK